MDQSLYRGPKRVQWREVYRGRFERVFEIENGPPVKSRGSFREKTELGPTVTADAWADRRDVKTTVEAGAERFNGGANLADSYRECLCSHWVLTSSEGLTGATEEELLVRWRASSGLQT